jgi:hypothetical protein
MPRNRPKDQLPDLTPTLVEDKTCRECGNAQIYGEVGHYKVKCKEGHEARLEKPACRDYPRIISTPISKPNTSPFRRYKAEEQPKGKDPRDVLPILRTPEDVKG